MRYYSQNVDDLDVRLCRPWPRMAEIDHRGSIVQLHGSLSTLRCTNPICSWRGAWCRRDIEAGLQGRRTACPECDRINDQRVATGKRPRGIGYLRPDVLLYGEAFADDILLDATLRQDVELGPKMLLIVGTSLSVPGVRVLVRKLAQAVHRLGGRVVSINPVQASATWAGIIDDCVMMEADAWAQKVEGHWDGNPGSRAIGRTFLLPSEGDSKLDMERYTDLTTYWGRWRRAFEDLEGREGSEGMI